MLMRALPRISKLEILACSTIPVGMDARLALLSNSVLSIGKDRISGARPNGLLDRFK